CSRTICGRGYSGRGLSGSTSLAQRVEMGQGAGFQSAASAGVASARRTSAARVIMGVLKQPAARARKNHPCWALRAAENLILAEIELQRFLVEGVAQESLVAAGAEV